MIAEVEQIFFPVSLGIVNTKGIKDNGQRPVTVDVDCACHFVINVRALESK